MKEKLKKFITYVAEDTESDIDYIKQKSKKVMKKLRKVPIEIYIIVAAVFHFTLWLIIGVVQHGGFWPI